MVKPAKSSLYNVLHIGPNYKMRRGGIASLLNIYSKEIKNFNFYPSAYFKNTSLNFLVLPLLWLGFIFYMIVKRNKIEIVHIHGASKGSFYRKYGFFYLAKYLFKKKVIFHLHGGKFIQFYKNSSISIQKKIEKLIQKSDLIIVLSKEWKILIQHNFSPKKVQVVPNMINAQKPVKKKDNMPITFVFLGKISKEKGIEDLIKIIIKNKEKWKGKLQVKIGGNGNVSWLKEKIEEEKLPPLLTYVGWVEGKSKQKLLKKSHVMLLPSYHEGLPISLLEGMSFSMPLIATKVGGIPFILKNKKNGICIEPGNLNQLGQAIQFFIDNPATISKQGEYSYKLAQDFFPIQVICILEQVYANINQAS